ncbi:tigger transposable element-derived protein 1-like [Sceloporus undulatus]|uniref:tigger transposable element-derived protein 1-like n=1 Tax=Sceloporus undulatus TaxID=8520 RepID=UPI001C4CD4C0|nr:tigger transposable element-derived protein 1-like [Sceloporus undulatus]XP_042296425.1 tigger transposable element-derived protein 1-like [Sceloporus undulatus]
MAPAKSKEKKAKRSHKVLNLQEKLELIQLSESGLSMSEIGRQLAVPRSTVSTIVKNKAKVLSEIRNATPMHAKVIRKQGSLIAEMEKVLRVWIQEQAGRNVPLSTRLIQAKALSLFHKMKAEKGEIAAAEKSFQASKGWFNRFKARSNLRNICKEKPPAQGPGLQGEADGVDAAAAATEMYPAELEKIIEDGGYTKQQVFNVDETALYWKGMPARVFIAKEEESVPGFEPTEEKLTLLLGANAAGDCKLKPMLIYHSENPRALKNYLKSSLPVYYKSNANAWMTADLFATWFSDYFKPTVEAYCREQSIPFKVLLLVDNAPGHPRALADSFKEIQVAFMPANTSFSLQPMEQGVISAFKSYYLRRSFAKAVAAISDYVSEGPKQNKLIAFWKGFTILDGIKTIRDAWEEVRDTTLRGVWKKLLPTFVDGFEGLEDPVEEIISDVVQMARELELEVHPEDVAEFLRPHDEVLIDGDFLISEGQRRFFREQGSLPGEMAQPRVLTTKELEEGIAKVEDAIAFWERVDPNFERSSKVNRGLQNQIACYRELLRERRRMSMRQTSLLSCFRAPPPQSWLVTPYNPSDSEPSTSMGESTPGRSPSKSPSGKRMRLNEIKYEIEVSIDEAELSPSDFLE